MSNFSQLIPELAAQTKTGNGVIVFFIGKRLKDVLGDDVTFAACEYVPRN